MTHSYALMLGDLKAIAIMPGKDAEAKVAPAPCMAAKPSLVSPKT